MAVGSGVPRRHCGAHRVETTKTGRALCYLFFLNLVLLVLLLGLLCSGPQPPLAWLPSSAQCPFVGRRAPPPPPPNHFKPTHRCACFLGQGLLPLASGTTLRAFLAERLQCDRMRITKKFRGVCFGKK